MVHYGQKEQASLEQAAQFQFGSREKRVGCRASIGE